MAVKLLSEQNFTAAVIAGAIAAILAAVAYGIVVERWPFSYGFAAAGVGIAIGFFMGFLGRGISMKFSVVATAYTIVGCLLGNMFVRIMNLAQATASLPGEVIGGSSLGVLARWAVSGLSPIHLVYWFVAVFAAVFLARRPLSRVQRLAIGTFESKA